MVTSTISPYTRGAPTTTDNDSGSKLAVTTFVRLANLVWSFSHDRCFSSLVHSCNQGDAILGVGHLREGLTCDFGPLLSHDTLGDMASP
jgi:hypothetical protein